MFKLIFVVWIVILHVIIHLFQDFIVVMMDFVVKTELVFQKLKSNINIFLFLYKIRTLKSLLLEHEAERIKRKSFDDSFELRKLFILLIWFMTEYVILQFLFSDAMVGGIVLMLTMKPHIVVVSTQKMNRFHSISLDHLIRKNDCNST